MTTANLQFRPYTPEDYQTCLSIVESTVPDYFSPEDVEDFKNFMQGAPDAKMFVMELEDQPIGLGGYVMTGDEARLVYGVVHRAYHGKGYGLALILHRLNQIQIENPEAAVTLETTEVTYGFFEKLGFHVVNIEKGFYSGKFDKYEMRFDPAAAP
ncbi:GNAT family N-acetyltransferase [Pontibacter sp. G13]|uniref:GNAT family N-acetyltransferase n=1 Tax=Pontibacter sp. G13 TaxID=3074898 RepID=UPI0028897312|nr:GNAT family N-acetyltransferase [Pontibacter sp. G13]WNJ17657.1 GNAT family N-acetyltransferase [Pontibacter sp. G13]